jgi:hypothetical protein
MRESSTRTLAWFFRVLLMPKESWLRAKASMRADLNLVETRALIETEIRTFRAVIAAAEQIEKEATAHLVESPLATIYLPEALASQLTHMRDVYNIQRDNHAAGDVRDA